MDHDAHFSLPARAHLAMVEEGFAPDLTSDAEAQLKHLESQPENTPSRRDLRNLLWSSIDNEESRDLDQVEVAEALPEGRVRLLVGIADVDAFVSQGSPIDQHAQENTCSVYTGVRTFPMLPEELSTDRTSLLEGQDRAAIVTEMVINSDGEVETADIYPALLHNRARLTYDEVGAWLEGQGEMPADIAKTPGMEGQIRLQQETAERLHARRLSQGALEFESVEAYPVVSDGRVVDLKVPPKNLARRIIENFMIAANTTMANYLETRHVPAIQRVVRSPQRWPRIVELAARWGVVLPPEPDPRALADFLEVRRKADPLRFPELSLSVVKLMGPGEYTVVTSPEEHAGHFGLAVYSYTHSTAPNRRYADLIVQRLLKSVVRQTTPPYSAGELTQMASHCTERENAARKVERLMRKVIAADLLSHRIGQTFDAIVTGVSSKGTFVRLIAPPVEGRVMRGEHGLDVGDRLRVRLIHTDPDRGFIDFEHA